MSHRAVSNPMHLLSSGNFGSPEDRLQAFADLFGLAFDRPTNPAQAAYLLAHTAKGEFRLAETVLEEVVPTVDGMCSNKATAVSFFTSRKNGKDLRLTAYVEVIDMLPNEVPTVDVIFWAHSPDVAEIVAAAEQKVAA